MHFHAKANEMLGFLNMLTMGKQSNAWKKAIPELDKNKFQDLTNFIDKNNLINEELLKHIDSLLKKGEGYSLDNFKALLPEKKVPLAGNIYQVYHLFYERSGIEEYAKQIETKINETGKPFCEKMATFYGISNPSDYNANTYVLASINGGGSCSLSRKSHSFQLLSVKTPIDEKTDLKRDVSKLFHETAHGILEDSGAEKVLNNYMDQNPKNHIDQLMQQNPKLKRHQIDDSKLMINEFLTTAFQKIFSKEVLGIETSYGDPTIAVMAEKLVPEIKDSLKEHTFDKNFIKKIEGIFTLNTTQEAIQKRREKSLHLRLLSGEKEGKRKVFPQWLQNPNWLWHKKQK